jgi:hypothetical protein
MVTAKKKDEVLSETTKSYLEILVKEQLFNRSKELSNKYLEKGNLVEEDSLDLITTHYGQLFVKNKETLSNDFIKGTPDLILDEKVIDIKSSWDLWTFPLFDKTIENKDYYWQLQCYMWLTQKKKAELIYCLNNTPDHLIVAEKRKQSWNTAFFDGTPEAIAAEEKIDREMIFDDISAAQRIKVLALEYEPSAIIDLQERIVFCRDYMNQLVGTL